MAKELGLAPRSLTKNIPSPTERWKAPVEDWVRDLHRKRFGRRPAAPPATPAVAPFDPAAPELRPDTVNELRAAEDDLMARLAS